LPRGLGDDPLARKRSPPTSVTDESTPVAVAPEGSHNDVFFRRRKESPLRVPAGTPTQAVSEAPEIAEVNDIVRVAEAAQTSHPAESPAPPADEPVAAAQATPSLTEMPEVPQSEASGKAQQEARKGGGFFRRLFGRRAK
jgi:hypothetical protein